MLLSMTGFGKASRTVAGKKITVEIKSLNSKQMDMSARVPSVLREKEIDIRSLVANRLLRGKVDVSVSIEDVTTAATSAINVDAMRTYKEQITTAAETLNIPTPADWFSTLLRMPEVLKTKAEDLTEEMGKTAMDTVSDAIEALISFRKQEGASLERVFTENIEAIRALLAEIEPFEKSRVEKIKERMRSQLESITSDYDKNRFEQELIFYIEKLDVSEEKNRLRNHLDYFMQTMTQEEASGKKLGFIAQEIGREVNTLGSKSNQSEMQIIVVKMKDHLEQIKEQVLNAL
ncbi:MAG: YicC family protein [Paludibacteraceae bacterium]|nr:YicC family protein [Paludibacteraceae bacterium]MCR4619085.1 YicC family protein [Paludibacteraceae bacterium]